MTTWVLALLNQFGYFAITFLIALENVFPPLPSEVILTFGGFLTSQTTMSVFGVIICATVGSLLGALLLYALGRQITVTRLSHFLNKKSFKLLGFKQNDAQKAINWFDHFGYQAVFYGRCIPVVRSLISIPAGSAKMPLKQFIWLTTLGSAIWNAVLVGLGAYMGKNWTRILQIFEDYTLIIAIILIVGFAYLTYRWYNARIKKQ